MNLCTKKGHTKDMESSKMASQFSLSTYTTHTHICMSPFPCPFQLLHPKEEGSRGWEARVNTFCLVRVKAGYLGQTSLLAA